MDRKIRVGILGATGAVGQRFIQLLQGHPWFEIVARRRQLTQRDKEAAYLLVGGTIFNVQTFLCCGDQSGRTQHLEMLRSVGDGNRCLVSQ